MFGVVRFEHLWMVSRVARRRFLILAGCSLALGILVALMNRYPKLFEGVQRLPIALRVAGAIVMVLAIGGGAIMFFAMVWYCVELDTCRGFVRLLFVLGMLSTLPFGQIVYYFLVYRPQTARVAMRII
jgi:hypothetical protein